VFLGLSIKIFAWEKIALYFCTRNDDNKTYKTYKETACIQGRLIMCFACTQYSGPSKWKAFYVSGRYGLSVDRIFLAA
jgi:hypothetical protein